MDPEHLLSPDIMNYSNIGSSPLHPPVVMESESAASPASNPAEHEDEQNFRTIRAYFDNDEHFKTWYGVILVLIGKLYDHMVKLYGGGEYEAVLKTIKAFLVSPGDDEEYDDPGRESIEKAEITLMSIATAKTNNKDNTVGTEAKFPSDLSPFYDGYREEIAWRVLFHHVVKMDEGNCSSQYKSLLLFVYNNIIDGDWHPKEVYRKTVEEVVGKLGEIENRKGMTVQEVMVDNATADATRFYGHMDDERASQIMRWAMSDRLIIREMYFRSEKKSVRFVFWSDELREPFEVLEELYDHIEVLDGGQCRYEYIEAFNKLFKQLRSNNSTPAGDLFKPITIKKMGINETKYQEIFKSVEKQMSYNDIKFFKGDEDDEAGPASSSSKLMNMKMLAEGSRKFELTAKYICLIYHHLLILDDCKCLVQYNKAFERIKDICLMMFLYSNSYGMNEVVDELYHRNNRLLKNTFKEIVEKKNIVTAAAGTEEASPRHMVPNNGDAAVRSVIQPRHNWLNSSEILQKLQNFKTSELTKEIQQRPPSGSLILYDTKALRFYKKDGYIWKKQNDGKTVTEGHMILKVGGHKKLHCYYAHSIDNKLQRRTYSLLNKSSSIRLVHYLDVNSEDNDESENVGREAEDNALDVRHDSPTRVKSVGTSSRTKKRPRRDSDGDDMNKETDNLAYFPQNANRTISTNTSSLDDEMVLLAKEVESLPGFGRGSDWFFLAMLSFKDKDNKALFKAMGDRDSKVRILKMILNL